MPKRSDVPTVGQVISRLSRYPDNLSAGQQLRRKHIVARCPELADLRRRIAS
ncbi:hypothetical protein ACFWWC_49595 [Streptomyces sp. NPDC058642]|uniref:hypothetical protein n=1 Tax=Streptomyces sp. NPDC058642 TaxID=3346572 RepID=UPI00365D4D7B